MSEPTYWIQPYLDQQDEYDPNDLIPDRYQVERPCTANLQGSRWTDGLHRPTLDIDVPMEVRESSTPGHYHLIFPTLALTDEQYFALLNALADAGIIERGYAGASIERKQTFLRTPWTRKARKRVEATVQ